MSSWAKHTKGTLEKGVLREVVSFSRCRRMDYIDSVFIALARLVSVCVIRVF